MKLHSVEKRVIPPFIIIDGPRGVGKSTTIKYMFEMIYALGFQTMVFKAERTDNAIKDMLNTIEHYGTGTANNFTLLVDRFHLSELVLRDFDGTVDKEQLYTDIATISSKLTALGVFPLLLTCEESVRVSRVKERADGRPDVFSGSIEYWNRFLPDGEYKMPEVDWSGKNKLCLPMDVTIHEPFQVALAAVSNAFALYKSFCHLDGKE